MERTPQLGTDRRRLLCRIELVVGSKRGTFFQASLLNIHTRARAHTQTHALLSGVNGGGRGKELEDLLYSVHRSIRKVQIHTRADQPIAHSAWVVDDDPDSGFCRKQVMTEVSLGTSWIFM